MGSEFEDGDMVGVRFLDLFFIRSSWALGYLQYPVEREKAVEHDFLKTEQRGYAGVGFVEVKVSIRREE